MERSTFVACTFVSWCTASTDVDETVEVQACSWATECSVLTCDEQCIANPMANDGINIPQLVNEKRLSAYACPLFSALIKLWNLEMEFPAGSIKRKVLSLLFYQLSALHEQGIQCHAKGLIRLGDIRCQRLLLDDTVVTTCVSNSYLPVPTSAIATCAAATFQRHAPTW